MSGRLSWLTTLDFQGYYKERQVYERLPQPDRRRQFWPGLSGLVYSQQQSADTLQRSPQVYVGAPSRHKTFPGKSFPLPGRTRRLIITLRQAKEIARGLDNLHGNNVVHGDLKPENIMISDSGHAQISDFGVSVIPGLSGFTTVINWNARHSAPELLPITDSMPVKPTKETDIFSLGILFMQLFDGRPECLPYNHFRIDHRDPHEINLIRAIHQGERPKFDRYGFQHQGYRWALIEKCWAPHPRSRPNIGQVRAWLA
ncbi:hypothetical protein HWV62_23462 [Athelia sp. TMB]|nr:hypothetical protein HWV62_23462 [Athelia sp. TMB]